MNTAAVTEGAPVAALVEVPESPVRDTWGIPGPIFLIVLAALTLAAYGAHVLIMKGLERPRAAAPTDIPSPEDLALLAGGRVRLVHAAIARLVEGGALRLSSFGRLSSTGRAPTEELDAEIVAQLDGGSRRVKSLASWVSDGRTAERFEARAVERGLIHPPATVRRRRLLAAVGIGWRREIDLTVENLPGVDGGGG